jgi:hypothetical protein
VMEIMSIKDCNLAKYMVKMVNNIVCFRLQQLAS